MSDNHIQTVLARLAELQATTAPIRLTIGYISDSNQVKHDAIVIHDAPSTIVTAMVNEFKYVSMTKSGLHVPVKSYKEQ